MHTLGDTADRREKGNEDCGSVDDGGGIKDVIAVSEPA
jgi:hypothetical protein